MGKNSISITISMFINMQPVTAAAIALSQRIQKKGGPAVQDYLSFLFKGCSEDPSSARRGGVDMASPAPVNDALNRFVSACFRA